ncbi:MAG: type III-B CRISPR module RAMP protein Cmr4 [Clostridiaceae bacterium]|nr:type III-B CRISPR module RAMP protein Cmr4 [Clostridiaceae bacterium]
MFSGKLEDGLNYYKKTYYAIATDPVHIGAGGARLERVDLPIIRETGTNIPKIPGTTLSGNARLFTAMATAKDKKEVSFCAGRGGDGGEKHCGNVNPACPVCVPFGFSKGSRSLQGLAQFFDARILFFAVSSMAGPVWVTSPLALEGLGVDVSQIENDYFYPLGGQLDNKKVLNFGWIMLNRGDGQFDEIKVKIKELPVPEIVKNRLVLVSDGIFPHIVNGNLEVRTSVSIDPSTGTAEEGALFTYEAIPRGTVLKFDVVYNSGKFFKVEGEELKTEDGGIVSADWVKNNVEKGLGLFETFGIGGMGTRGMGRLKVLNLKTEKDADNKADGVLKGGL